jgi:hypothetical protein
MGTGGVQPPAKPEASGSRAKNFYICSGSLTTPGRAGLGGRVIAPAHVAFRDN